MQLFLRQIKFYSMAKNETKRLKPSLRKSDEDSFSALQNIAGYSPSNANYTVAIGSKLLGAMQDAQTLEAQKFSDWESARDDANAAEWAFHNYVLGVKGQVGAQYTDDSNEYQSMGLKKKSEYKSPKRKPKGGDSTTPKSGS
jgi:hypothetical protein